MPQHHDNPAVDHLRAQFEQLQLVIDTWAVEAELIAEVTHRHDYSPLLHDVARLRTRILALYDSVGGLGQAIERSAG